MSRQVDIKALVSHIVRGDGSDRCRICMGDTTEGQVHLEDTVMMDGDKPVTLAELLEVITGVEVEHRAPLPNKICVGCNKELTSILPFIKRCQESTKLWNQITDCLLTFLPSVKAKNVYIEIGSDIKTYQDTSRSKISKITTKKEALQCFKFRLRRQKIYRSRSETVGQSGQTKIAKGKPKMSCPNCAAPFQCFFKFNLHLREVRKKICRFCYEILDYSDYVEHSKSHNLTVFACPICSETFEKESALSSHKLKHAKGPEECLECHETFANSGHLNKHMNIKHKPIVCGCDKKLPNRVCFFKHKKICDQHGNIKSKFICDYCKAEYKKKNNLKMHIKLRHTVGWIFQCDVCGKTFSSRAHLIEHGTTHDKIIDRHVCYCGAQYSSRRGYERHLKKHTLKHTKVKRLRAVKEKKKTKATASITAEMELDPALPCGLCRSCSDDTVAAITFKNLCAMSAHHWAEASNYISQPPNPTEDDKAFFILYNDERTIVKDQIARVPTTKDAEDRLNMKWVKPVKIRKPRRHGSIKEPCKCPDCGKKFSTPDYLNYHLRNTLKRACRRCRMVVQKKKLARHLLTNHNIQLFECNICNKLFEEEELVRQHYVEAHGKLMHTCSHCGNSYVNERALRAHIHSHTLFHCSSCNMSYDNVKCFKYHQQVCEFLHRPSVEFKFFTCDHCGVTYNRKPSLRIHIIQKHLNVLPYVCQTCGKRTSTLAHLRSHEKVHKTERNIFQCVCGVKLTTELGYQLHQRIHTGERPYKCEHCGDRFLSSSRRLDHIKRRHRGAKDFKHGCEQCSARFVRPCELKKHYLSVHYSVVEVKPAKREINPITRRLRNTIEKD